MIDCPAMKQYVIDELRPEDHEKIKTYLDENFEAAGINGIYRLQLDRNLLNDVQTAHTRCQPFYFSVELASSRLSFEFLARSSDTMRCNCIDYATPKQRKWLMEVADAILEKLGIKV